MPAAARFGPAVFYGGALATIAIAAALAFWLRPEPHSDWLYYWTAAGDPSLYRRGGVGLWLLAAFKALGLDPVGASLALNGLAALAFAWLAWRAGRGRLRWLASIAMAYLLLLAPFLGIVQLDLVAAVMLAAGLLLVVASPPGGQPRWWNSQWGRRLLAGLLVAGAASTKPQYALVLWTFAALAWALALLPWCRLTRRWHGVLAVLVIGSAAGLATDYALRDAVGNTRSMRTSSAVTLYGGLLVSGTGTGCGYWSVAAAEAAKEDLRRPLPIAIRDRLAAKPVSHWLAVLRCKLPQVVRPTPFSLYWLVESPNVRARLDAHPRRDWLEHQYQRVLELERRAYSIVTLAILVLAAGAAVLGARRGAPLPAALPLLWILAFWLVHLVFEIQGRYFLGMFLLAPFIASLTAPAWRAATVPATPREGLAQPGESV